VDVFHYSSLARAAGFSKESSSFLQKRTKKLLPGCRGRAGDSRVKVFASFFKKTGLLAYSRRHPQLPAQYLANRIFRQRLGEIHRPRHLVAG
jgi:hypothetical protein